MRPMAYRLLLAFSLLSAFFASPSSAEIYRPWCARYYGNNGGGTNCGFVSYEQCMMTARGAGAWCVRNPWNVAYGQGRSDRGRRVW
jgi:hypothetical protein